MSPNKDVVKKPKVQLMVMAEADPGPRADESNISLIHVPGMMPKPGIYLTLAEYLHQHQHNFFSPVHYITLNNFNSTIHQGYLEDNALAIKYFLSIYHAHQLMEFHKVCV